MRYIGIFFGMLTLAFGMLFHSFLFKFYHFTGGDSGMRVPRMNILGLDVRALQQDRVPGRAILLLLPRPADHRRLVMWRIVHSPFGLHLRTMRDNARKAEYLGVHVHRFRLAAFVISAAFGAVGGAILGFRVGLADPELFIGRSRASSCSWRCSVASRISSGRSSARSRFTLLQDQLQSLTEYWRFVLGAILALIVIAFPEGIAGLAADLRRRIARKTA